MRRQLHRQRRADTDGEQRAPNGGAKVGEPAGYSRSRWESRTSLSCSMPSM
ncbi:hypothetical protein AAGU66_13835 [Edwardsiella ictaluri]|uniref:Uncharacterized protein n=1 Tax=Edwardsiella ictaluri (strain 93-146) TaxID=634503 RepID=C5BEV0_EDWI9|nr:hypothetical protein [Edwardsiella ictaluri]ACR70338.1 hypothetical protein NT01EI_3188 [Edwardsiella ictaluri 93-146]UCQ47234.1 hypothetical protein DB741_14655 [Edwardsiella ictaluri]UCQ50496.1 hypothetical protein DB731_14635 [Edwardsiella ictaluri]UYB61148.1 hypothetical protein N8I66_14350 [Edwardsiella ictaluri]UYB64374.1 hypothetical protein N8I67_14345 [Edwardsiella ictaluri]